MTDTPKSIIDLSLQARIALEERLLKKHMPHGTQRSENELGDDALDDEALQVEMLRRIQKSMQNWTGENCGRSTPIFGSNLEGTLTPLFWCFNSKFEPTQLAKYIGADQPVYAMRSLNQLFGTGGIKARIVPMLAKVYAAEIERIYPAGPYLIGGNCQSAPIVEAACRALVAKGKHVAQMTFLDAAPPKTLFQKRLHLLYGKTSDRNPFLTEQSPEEKWKETHTNVVWDQIDGGHGTYFTDQNLPSFVRHLKARLAEAVAAS